MVSFILAWSVGRYPYSNKSGVKMDSLRWLVHTAWCCKEVVVWEHQDYQ